MPSTANEESQFLFIESQCPPIKIGSHTSATKSTGGWSMALTERSDFLDNPKLCVSRQISACSICRGKKIRCDGLVPVCSPCQRSRRESECTNGSDKLAFAKGKERSYVTALENRLDKLEKEIAQAKGHIAKVNASVTPAELPAGMAPVSKVQRKEECHLNELVSDFGFLSVNATSRDFDGLALESFAQLMVGPSVLVKLPASDINVVPSRQSVVSLIQHYIDHDLTFYPFISETSIFGSVQALYEGYATPWDEWTIFLILAITLTSLSTSPDGRQYDDAVRYVGAVQKNAKMVLLPGSVQSIQMMLLLVQYSLRDPHHFDSWYLVGAAARMMVDLGLHQEPRESFKRKDTQLELRRRIFHSVYSFDRATSLVHQRAFSFTDDSTNVELPRQTSLTSYCMPPESACPAIELIRLRRVVSVPYMALYQSSPDVLGDPWPIVQSAHQELDKWEYDLRQTNLGAAVQLLFRAEMLFSKIVLLSPDRLVPPLQDYGHGLILEYASYYSQTMSSLVENMSHLSFCSSYDLLRAIFVAQRIMNVVTRCGDVDFGEALPLPPDSRNPDSYPRPSAGTGRERLALTLSTFSTLNNVIAKLGTKYGLPNTWLQLQPHFQRVHASLRSRS